MRLIMDDVSSCSIFFGSIIDTCDSDGLPAAFNQLEEKAQHIYAQRQA